MSIETRINHSRLRTLGNVREATGKSLLPRLRVRHCDWLREEATGKSLLPRLRVRHCVWLREEATGKSLLPRLGATLHHSFAALLFSLSAFSASADADWGFNYQAEIRDAEGKVIVDGTGAIVHKHIVTIQLYDRATQGTALWGRKFDVRCDDNGLFNVFLSDSEGYPVIADKEIAKVIRAHSPGGLYIGLTVGDGAEILPRQRLCAVPFANLSQNLAPGASALGDLTVVSNCTVSGDCTVSGS